MKLKILAIGILLITISNVFAITSNTTENINKKFWKCELKEPWLNWMIFVSDNELKNNNTYEKLRTFFKGCNSPKNFYDRIQQCVNESLDIVDDYDLPMTEKRLSVIVDTIADNKSTLWCTQQTFLFIAGVKAMFSHYDEKLMRYILNDECGDFKLEIWRCWLHFPPKLPFRTHVQIVVDMWNGTDTFEINDKNADKIEIDNWENEYREFDKTNDCLIYSFFPAKINSVLYTKELCYLMED